MSKHHPNLQRALVKLVTTHPFYASVAMHMDLQVVSEEYLHEMSGGMTKTAATDGESIWLSAPYIEKAPHQELVSVIQHEVEHVARLHPWRCGQRDSRVWNHACDAVINHSIVSNGGALPAGVVDGTTWAGQTEEQIYGQLPVPPPNGGGKGGGQGAYQPHGKQGGSAHDSVLPNKNQSQAAQAKAKQMIAKAMHAAKAQGAMPAHLQAEIDELLNPTIDWREPLRRFLTETANTDYSWKRINRRFVADGIYLPGIAGENRARKLGVLIDTSGSIGAEELRFYFSELIGAIEECCPSQLVIAYCDSEVQHSDTFDEPSSAEVASTRKRHGGGGTSMPEGLRWFGEHHDDVQAVIVLTDMYTDFNPEPAFPVLWATENTTIKAPYGETLVLVMDRD